MCIAFKKVLTEIPVCSSVAMTSEIPIRREILPIGGLKEKLQAAKRGGIRIVLIPDENLKNLPLIPDNYQELLRYTTRQMDRTSV
jgi:ATP-dependent Lon protease